jgi:hypothetical protein
MRFTGKQWHTWAVVFAFAALPGAASANIQFSDAQFTDADSFSVDVNVILPPDSKLAQFILTHLNDLGEEVPDVVPHIDTITATLTASSPLALAPGNNSVKLKPSYSGSFNSVTPGDVNILFLQSQPLSSGALLELNFDVVGPLPAGQPLMWLNDEETTVVDPVAQLHLSFLRIALDETEVPAEYSFSATFVPEPQSYLMVAVGLGLLGILRLRRSR